MNEHKQFLDWYSLDMHGKLISHALALGLASLFSSSLKVESTLLGVTATYKKEFADINLKVITTI